MFEHFGKKGKDVITGFRGICIGYTEYISGCCQVLLTPEAEYGTKRRDGEWFDLQRVVYKSEPAIVLENDQTPGFDQPAPKR